MCYMSVALADTPFLLNLGVIKPRSEVNDESVSELSSRHKSLTDMRPHPDPVGVVRTTYTVCITMAAM